MSQRDNDPATGRPGGSHRIARGQAHQTATRDQSSVPDRKPSVRRWNIGRDAAGAVLLLIALALPWNLYFGMGIPGSSKVVGLLLILVTVFSLVSVAVTYVGPGRLFGSRANPVLASWLRLSLNAAYLLLVLAFVVFDEVQTLRYGGTIKVSGGLGPGAWLGIAGSLLCAQPVITHVATADGEFVRWLVGARLIGYASIIGALLSFVFVLYWRVRYALPSAAGTSGFGKQNIAVIVTAVVYGVVALATVVLASNWIIQDAKSSRLVTVVLGAATLVAGLIVWILPIGREIDGFHGIAQSTSTAGVGFEGYLAWAAAAAILSPRTLGAALSTRPIERSLWREAARKGLLLIVVWCAGSMLMRITDLLVAVSLNFPFSRYDSMALAAFDLLTALVAVWLRANLANVSLPERLVWSVCGMLVTLTIARIVMGIVLAPRFLSPKRPVGVNSAVYGNNLAQQITSTFDVVLCGLALAILAVAIVTRQYRHRTPQSPPQARRQAHSPTLPAQPPRIHRTSQDPTHRSPAAQPKIYRTP